MLKGKRGLVLGVANERSLTWGIAKMCHAHGAEIALTYQGEVLKKRVEPLASELNSPLLLECDLSRPEDIETVFDKIGSVWGEFDFLVHGIGFSKKEELRGPFIETTRENFLMTMDISCYSFIALAQKAVPLMKKGGSLLTLTYYGAVKVVPHYNVMGLAKAALECGVRYLAEDVGKYGIRVNAISAGPVKTLAASGIGDFKYILKWNQLNSPLRRNTTLEDVGGAALFLISHLSGGVTGETLYVDSGYHVVGMKAIDAPDIALERD